ncbi:protein transporter SEC23, partial [Colletotrichum scovillei]
MYQIEHSCVGLTPRVTLLILVSRLAPLGDRLAVENENVEEGVEKKDMGGLNRSRVQQHRLATLLIKR